MAQKRMFSLDVCDTDRFLDLPASSQCLYFHLGLRADDDGFVGSPRKIAAMVNASPDDMKLLAAKGFIIPFASGVCVITHWRQNNYLRPDRYTPTVHTEEKSLLSVCENKAYFLEKTDGQPFGIPSDNQMVDQRYTQSRLEKIREEKIREDIKADKPPRASRFTPPTVEEVAVYCKERGDKIDPQHFVDFYTAKGWCVGNQPMKDWKAAVRTWEKRDGKADIRSPKNYTYEDGESL